MYFVCPIQPGDHVWFKWRPNPTIPMTILAVQCSIDDCIVKIADKWYLHDSVYRTEDEIHKIPQDNAPPLEPGCDK